jgi:hypothetical protein
MGAARAAREPVSTNLCSEMTWRMLVAFGAGFFALGFRFALLRWRELDIARERIHAAVKSVEHEAHKARERIRSESEIRLSTASSPDGLAESVVASEQESADARVVRATSSHPPAPPSL